MKQDSPIDEKDSNESSMRFGATSNEAMPSEPTIHDFAENDLAQNSNAMESNGSATPLGDSNQCSGSTKAEAHVPSSPLQGEMEVITAALHVSEPVNPSQHAPNSASLHDYRSLKDVDMSGFNSPAAAALDLDVWLSRCVAIVIVTALSVGWLIVSLVRWEVDWIFGVITAAVCVVSGLLLWFGFVWPKWEHAAKKWRLDEQGFDIRKGVFWKHQITVPAARVQHVDVGQGPLQRRYGVANLTIHTAGTTNASVTFEGLDYEVALELRDRLVLQKESADVV
jgi:uncharacterized protein